MKDFTQMKLANPKIRKHIFVVFLFLVITLVAYGTFYEPAIFEDDWTQLVEGVTSGEKTLVDITNRRPMLYTPFLIQHHLFGLNINAYYAILMLLNVLLALMIYSLLNRFPIFNRNGFAIMVPLLFLVYPTTYTHMWLTMLHGYTAIGLTTMYALLLLLFIERGNWLRLVAALILLVISFAMYEAQIGLAGLWALILFTAIPTSSKKRRWSMLILVALVLGLFVLWRTIGYELVGVNDERLDMIDISPSQVVSRLMVGLKITLVWGWTSGLQQLFPWVRTSEIALVLFLGILLAAAAVIWLGTRIIDQSNSTEYSGEFSQFDRRRQLRHYLKLGILALATIAAGYFPVIGVYTPNLSGYGSRFNLVATIGGALFFTTLLMSISILLSRSEKQTKLYLAGLVIPLVAISVLIQSNVQRSNRIAWQEQTTIWHSLFLAAPDFRNETFVLLILPNFTDRTGFQNWRRTPLKASWEVSSAIRLLYDRDSLSGDVYFPDIDRPSLEPRLLETGVMILETGEFVPYSLVTAFTYDSNTSKIRQLDELPAEYIENSDVPAELCTTCVLQFPSVKSELRALVKQH